MTAPTEIAQLMDVLTDAGTAHRVDPYLLAAIVDRESRGGLALRPVGFAGTGDWAPRHSAKYRADLRYNFFGELPVRQSDGKQIYLPHYMPSDGQGWGRGIFQIDYAAWPEFVDSGAWMDIAKSADFAAKLLAKALGRFGQDELAAIASYNAGEGAVAAELEELTDPKTEPARLRALDSICTGGNYVSDVLRRRAKFLNPPTQPFEQPKENA